MEEVPLEALQLQLQLPLLQLLRQRLHQEPVGSAGASRLLSRLPRMLPLAAAAAAAALLPRRHPSARAGKAGRQ